MAKPEYFKRFPTVEVQQTFYQPPRLETLRNWRRAAPPEFQFHLKAWQLITHEPSSSTYRRLKAPVPEDKRNCYGSFRPTDEVLAAWQMTLESAQALEARVIVFQCPASFSPTQVHIENLRRFFRTIKNDARDFLLGWEPRGEWPEKTVRELCSELGLLHVVDPFKAKPVTAKINYFRLHGIGGYRYRYTDSDLSTLLSTCNGTAYCLFNNVSMFEDAQRFLALIQSACGLPKTTACRHRLE